MSKLRYLLAAFVTCMVTTSAVAASAEIDEKDEAALSRFIEGKRSVAVDEKGGELRLAGDVRVEFARLSEKTSGARVTHNSSGKALSDSRWDVEANLYFDYKTQDTWAKIQLEFDQRQGLDSGKTAAYINQFGTTTSGISQGSGTSNNFALKEAWFGMNVFGDGASQFDVEFGRKRMGKIFDSEIQFDKNFDGILLTYSNSFEGISDFYVKLGSFVVDYHYNHQAWIGELGFLNILDSGFDFKYSYVDWSKNGTSGGAQNNTAFRFRNSQFTMAYNLNPEWIGMDAVIYGAYLINHDAVAASTGKKNKAWYLGAGLGKLEKRGDYAADLNYQSVQRNAIAHYDVAGIGTLDRAGTKGQAGYKGWDFTLGYNVTDNITLNFEWEKSKEQDRAVTGEFDFSKVELELVYAF